MDRFSFALLLFIAAVFSAACGGGVANNQAGNAVANSGNKTPATPLPAATIDELASGKKIYADNCMICHKEDGTGGEVEIEGKKLNPDDLTSAKIKGFSDEKILGYIKNGVEDEGMPAFKDKLSEAQMRDVLKFVRTEIQKMPAKPAESPKN